MDNKTRAVADKLIDYFVENLRIPREIIGYDTPLFGEGIGLDSVDSLEIIVGIDLLFKVSVLNIGHEHFQTVGTLSNYIANALGCAANNKE